jgi:hypothetical protein
MKKNHLIGLIVGIVCLGTCFGLVAADTPNIKEIIDNYAQYRHQTLTISGEITAVVYRETVGLHVVNLNSKKNDSGKKDMETGIYLVSDATDGIYVISTRHYDEQQKVSIKTNILMNSEEPVGEEQAILYDKYVSAKSGFSSPDYSEFTLKELLKNMPEDKAWVLLIEI